MLIAPEAKMSLIRVVTYVSVVTKIHPESPQDSQGPRVTGGGLGGQSQTSFNQNNLLAKVVLYAYGYEIPLVQVAP